MPLAITYFILEYPVYYLIAHEAGTNSDRDFSLIEQLEMGNLIVIATSNSNGFVNNLLCVLIVIDLLSNLLC
jgi:hypothetical protein